MLLLAAALATPAHANLVLNGGFETGDFTGWTELGDPTYNIVWAGNPHSGFYAGLSGPVDVLGGISQSIATIAGHSYEVSFWLSSEQSLSGIDNSFDFSFGGQSLFSLTNADVFPYEFHSFTVTVSGSQSDLVFSVFNKPDWFEVDDVSVIDLGAAVPEPASWAMMIGGLALAGGALRAAGRKRRLRVAFG